MLWFPCTLRLCTLNRLLHIRMVKPQNVLIDLSGTLHIEDEITPNAVQALSRLRATNVNIKFVTNTTKESQRILHERLTRLGFDVQFNEIFTSLSAARDLLKKEGLKPYLLISDEALEDFKGLDDFEGDPDAVVVGLAPDKFGRDNMNKAFRSLLKGARLIAVHEGKYYKRKDGLALGPGPFVKVLEYATGQRATVVGKPSENFFLAALDGADPSSAVMIGDDVNDDIGGAQKLGMKGYLVKTGKYRDGDESKITPGPFKTCQNFASVVEELVQEINE